MNICGKMAESFGLDTLYLSEYVSNHNREYKKYYIKKKNGGQRVIFHPSKELKMFQRWLVKNVYFKFPISNFSTAYCKKCSIKNNAQKHINSKYMLHLDVENFFPSITRQSMINYFKSKTGEKAIKELDLSVADIDFMLDVSLYSGRQLVIGSVSSPIISNIYMYDFDMQLNCYLIERGDYVFTRYADDLVISSNKYIPIEIIDDIEKLLENYNLTMNKKKTYFASKRKCRRVTGVVLDNNKKDITIGHERYRIIQRQIYNYLVKGIGDINYIEGYLNYVKDINYRQYEQLKNTYSRYDNNRCLFF